jgi:hypothetical protein
MIAVATLLYRMGWSSGSDYETLYGEIEDYIKFGDFDADDLSLTMWSLGDEGVQGVIDLCVWKDDSYNIMGEPAQGPTICEDNGGRQVRADFRGLGWEVANSEAIEEKGPRRASKLLSTVAREVDTPGIHTIVQDKTANDKLAGKKARKAWMKAMRKHGPAIAGGYRVSSQAPAEQRVVELVLAAREADEAGAPMTADALMGLALADYRRAVPEDTQTEGVNAAIDALIQADYAGVPGLELYAPEGSADFCFTPEGTCAWLVGRDTHWECAGAGLTLTRLTNEEAQAAGCTFE